MDGRREHSGFRSCRTGAWSGGSYGLVAIIVAAVLLFVVVPILSLRHWQLVETRRAEVQATREILSNFEVYLNAFKKAAGRYPTTTEGLHVLEEPPADSASGRTKPLVRRVPPDPWGNRYQYVCPGTHNVDSYDLCSFGPDGNPGGEDDITNWGDAATPQ